MFYGYPKATVIAVKVGRRFPCRVSALLGLCVAGVLVLCAGVAQAEPPKLIPYGTFDPGPLPLGIAVDDSGGSSRGDVYTAAYFSSNINKFDASGKLISPPSPFGEGFFAGVAVNPLNGDVDVITHVETNPGMVAINTYNSGTGELLSSFEVPASNNFFGGTVVQIATDSAGNVYVPIVPENKVQEYSPTGTPLNAFTGSGVGVLKGPTGVAVDSSGDLWVADRGDNRIEELSPTDTPVSEIKSEGVEWAALNGGGDVFAIVRNSADFCGTVKPPCPHLVEYSAAGVQLADVGAGSFEAGPPPHFPPMVAVDEANGRVYVTDASNELVRIFAPPAAPVVSKELVAEVGPSEAKLGSLVNPGGITTTYRFEYGTTTAYGQSTPFPEGSVGEGFSSRAVWAAASGLASGVTYHYRVVATNELGTVAGPDQTFTTESVEQASCPNEALRGGFSARLPDCRAYELVTPSTKTSVQIEGISGTPAADGDAISFTTKEPLPGAPTGGETYLATRGLAGWTSEDMIPLESSSGLTCEEKLSGVSAYSDELSKALVSYGLDSRASGSTLNAECNAEGLQVTSGEPVGYENLLLRDNATGSYQLVNATPPGATPADAHFQGASADLSHILFSELAPLTPGAPAGGENLYEWDEGVLRLATVLPDGALVQGTLAQASNGSSAISADGSHVLFTAGNGLYMRIDGERTVQVDESHGGATSGGGSFQAMSTDGSKVFFTDESKLTTDSTAELHEPDLYECEIAEEEQAGKSVATCKLSDLTIAKTGEHANVLRVSVLGSEDDGPHVYFLAKGVLASNTLEYTDSEGNRVVEGAEDGKDNLYLWDGGTTTFIATLIEGVDQGVGAVPPDGSWFAFVSRKSLTGYDNLPSEGSPVEEIFLYDAASRQLVCASCNHSGEAPIAGDGAKLAPFAQRPLADGGRLFFDTSEALVPSDTNGQVDVYEYEDGQPSLISSGTSSQESNFLGASESGDDVFFLARQQLVPQDTEEEARLIYDARAGGGFAEPSSPSPCTTADACRTPVSPQPSIFGAPSSATFSGAGNLTSSTVKPKTKPKPKPVKCKKAFVKKKGRCVKRPKKAKKSAHANRRTVK
jgi:hypothetical protein